MNTTITAAARRTAPWTIWGFDAKRLAVVGQVLAASASSVAPSDAWERGRQRFLGWLKEFEKARAQRTLEQRLGRIIETANGHQAKGLPKGSPVYVALLQRAQTNIEQFCTAYGVERLDVQEQVPALRDLEALTQAPPPTARLAHGLALIILGLGGATGVGCLCGLVAVGYHWVVSLLVH